MAVLSRRNFGNIELLRVNSNPSGVSAPLGSLATLTTNGAVYKNVGETTWQLVTSFTALNPTNDGPGGSGGGGSGPQGSQGVQGFTGFQGNLGSQGAAGHQGHAGEKGFSGEGGSQGPQGSQGAIGHQGHIGIQGSQGSQGQQGDLGETTQKGFDGHQGPQGAQGQQGSVGHQGHQGSAGHQGAQGQSIIGQQGAQGSQGLQGHQGSPGPTGIQGQQGIQGFIGPQGMQGSPGAQGAQGDSGSDGSQGSQGAQGAQGSQGAQGPQGAAGTGFGTNYLVLVSSQYVTGASTASAITFSGLDPDTVRMYVLKGRLIIGGSSAATTYNFTLKPGNINPTQTRYNRTSTSAGTSQMVAPATFYARPGSEYSFSLELNLHKSTRRGMVGSYVGFDVSANLPVNGTLGWTCDTDGSTNITSLTFTADASPNSWIAAGSEFHLYKLVH